MGIESFYVKLYTNKKEEDLYSILGKKFLDVLSFSFEENYLILTGTIISFLPYCDIIFQLCSKIDQPDILIESLTSKKSFKDFKEKNTFISWMISVWGKKIEAYHSQMGSFIVKPETFYKDYRKLKKYLKRTE